MTRQLYQLTLEALLAHDTSQTLLWIDANQLEVFKATYGPSAYICRYMKCSRATHGFDTPMRRDEHEAAHQRKYRCTYPSCVYFSSGFATKNSLNRHNEAYHSTILKNASLSEGIVLALRQVRRSPAFHDLRLGKSTNEQHPTNQIENSRKKARVEHTESKEAELRRRIQAIQEQQRVKVATSLLKHRQVSLNLIFKERRQMLT
jgi:hypothetical protein